jgi:4-amino-4-deoxy-L-arabinose transferase-like glycosyltransferase
MTRADRFALLLSLVAVAVTYLVTDRVFERMPHIEDEIAYVWQAQALARGHLTLTSPPSPESFLVPFVVDYHGQRFGKYPLGWPAMLAIGVGLGARSLVNPLLAGLGVWLTYRLGKRTLGVTVGLLAAGMTITSPFFLMNSGSLLSHPFGLVLTVAFALAWLDAWDPSPRVEFASHGPIGRWLPTLVAAFCLGLLILTRPLTAVGVALPFAIHGVYLLVRRDWETRRRLLVFGAIVLALASLHFLWQYAVTGDPTLNPYTLWWKYDTIGFGPGVGRSEAGHTLRQARINTNFSLYAGMHDLFGWGRFSWIFLPFGLIPILRQPKSWPVIAIFPSLVLVYLAYWIGSSLFGPRYYYEGLISLTLASAAGIAFLAGWPTRPCEPWHVYSGWRKARPLAMTAILALLVCANLLFYTPIRLSGMHALYGISRARLEPFLTPQSQALAPAIFVVHPGEWTEYGALLEMQDPFLDTPFLFVISIGRRRDAELALIFPDRKLYHYYPDDPYMFYPKPRQ